MRSPTIIVTGSNGQLGSELKDLSSAWPQFSFVFLTRNDLSISDDAALKNMFESYQPGWLINCAAYTAVDRAESEQELAFDINANAVGHLAFLCREHQTGFIHISTDYVFNGLHQSPWKETDDTDPVNTYGASKLQGEFKAMKNDPHSIIIRTSWVYSSYGKNFVKTMMKLMKERPSVSVVNDQYGSPTYAADLAKAIMLIISSGEHEPGLFHFSNSGHISWYEFAMAIRDIMGSSCEVLPISSDQYPTPAKRPRYSVMDTRKIWETYNIQAPYWRDSLETCMKKLMAST